MTSVLASVVARHKAKDVSESCETLDPSQTKDHQQLCAYVTMSAV
jgi:hypothetical protein